MGESNRHDEYRDFISAGQEENEQKAEALTHVRTSCAMFVRAVHLWCGFPPMGPYMPGTPMFTSMGNVSFNHPSFVPLSSGQDPHPGDCFYIAPDATSPKGHTGLFVRDVSGEDDGKGGVFPEKTWLTAEGGGGDGTVCRLSGQDNHGMVFPYRTIRGNSFTSDDRTLFGWFDCTKIGLPESPAPALPDVIAKHHVAIGVTVAVGAVVGLAGLGLWWLLRKDHG